MGEEISVLCRLVTRAVVLGKAMVWVELIFRFQPLYNTFSWFWLHGILSLIHIKTMKGKLVES